MSGGFGLSGRIAVVTGAASGIGRAIAEALADEGARVVVLDRDEGAARAAASTIGRGTHAIACDVSDPDAVAAAASGVADATGPADILVNNAGIIRPGGLDDLDPRDWNALIAVNLTGYFLCAQAFGRQMRRGGRGAIVHVSSIAAAHATPMTGAYSVAKAGVSMLSRQLAIEWGRDGIRSNCVCPGMIRTPLSESMYARPGVEEARAAAIPAGRIGRSADVARAVLFLSSDLAEYVTGEEVTVDGGFVRNLMSQIPRAGYEGRTGEAGGCDGSP